MRCRLAAVAISAAVLSLAGGCASPSSRFYTLSAEAVVTAAPAAPVTITMGPVSIPAVVDRPQIVVSEGANQVRLDEFNRWASPLADNIAQVIAANLARALGTTRVWAHTPAALQKADYQVLIDVQRFQVALGDAGVIDALWTVRSAAGGAVKTGRSLVREPTSGAGFDPLVAAQSRALARVSADIAAAIRAP